jgi:hypothetical protein
MGSDAEAEKIVVMKSGEGWRLILESENWTTAWPREVDPLQNSVLLATHNSRKSASSSLSTHPLRRLFYQHSP